MPQNLLLLFGVLQSKILMDVLIHQVIAYVLIKFNTLEEIISIIN
jgi:hypothetical protein